MPNEINVVRSHPWVVSAHDPNHKQYDFRKNPDLISKVLEDFVPWNNFAATQTFYDLIRWLNSSSQFESNDCAFDGPKENSNPNFRKTLQTSGRLMILFNDLRMNTSKAHVKWLREALHHYLTHVDYEFEWGVVGITELGAKFENLPVTDDKKIGFQLKLTFWAWGNDVRELMENVNRLFQNLHSALKEVSREIEATNNILEVEI